ncbi:bifunctional RNase H/acid phosphatase [Actinopolymorpha pittospori]|uniref:Phosphoglycerate mutase n=1 Tax=Actinopolymorpha pittospori TaxID=648752 RepID=A0A927MYZ5_9ACTN|nr:bifunctional RNase H/acid phosphatase [Actinopolymorpha pittospori]MBE1609546.1 putative phosphoglycerate mutase [Actinopolymorpha pittospori]
MSAIGHQADANRRRLVVEADGGSRGNPGPAAFGALVRDPGSGAVLAEAAEPIGTATNNVAEYRGLIAGLRLTREIDQGAAVEVRMDSKLVVEQMAGRWKVKHADMRRLALEAREIAPPDTVWTWVPRERNKAADALLNKVLDGGDPVWAITGVASADGADSGTPGSGQPGSVSPEDVTRATSEEEPRPLLGWGDATGSATTLLLVRHGETVRSVAKRFSGTGGEDVSLTERGRAQAQAAAALVAARADRSEIAAVVSSPLRRTRETAAFVAEALGLPVTVEPGFAETAFGDWDGLTFAEVRDRWPAQMDAWLASTAVAPPNGESFDDVLRRVRSARDRLIRNYAGRSVVVVTHVTPIKLLTCMALDVPTRTVFRMELPPGSATELQWYADGLAALRSFGVVPSDS